MNYFYGAVGVFIWVTATSLFSYGLISYDTHKQSESAKSFIAQSEEKITNLYGFQNFNNKINAKPLEKGQTNPVQVSQVKNIVATTTLKKEAIVIKVQSGNNREDNEDEEDNDN